MESTVNAKPATAASAVPPPTSITTGEPKFVLKANSIDELCVLFAEIMLNNEQFLVKDNKSGNGNKYAVWKLDDGLNVGRPGMEGLGLNVEQARRLGTKDGYPSILGIEILFRQLTPLANIPAKKAEREVAVSTRETELEQKLAAIRARKQR